MKHETNKGLSGLCRLWSAGFNVAIALVLHTQLVACIPIFASPTTESQFQDVEVKSPDHRVTILSPANYSNLADRLNEEIERELVGAENVDAKGFWEALFPEGKDRISLQELLQPDLLAHAEQRCIDHLVFIATEVDPPDDWGTLFLGQTTLRSRYNVGIVDPKQCGSMKTLQAVAQGTGAHAWIPAPYIGFFIFGKDTPKPADLDEEVVQELASRIAAEIKPSTPGSDVRFLLLDAEFQEGREGGASPTE
jgi:hypothetical protein